MEGLLPIVWLKCNIYSFLIYRSASNTQITLCGCGTIASPAVAFPPSGTPPSCLSISSGTLLTKRAQVFPLNLDGYQFSCNNDTNGNPHQDCLNALGYICNIDYIGGNANRIRNCKERTDQMIISLSSPWRDVRINCGKWPFDGSSSGSPTSPDCTNANIALQQKAFYTTPEGKKIPVTFALTDSVNQLLWSIIQWLKCHKT